MRRFLFVISAILAFSLPVDSQARITDFFKLIVDELDEGIDVLVEAAATEALHAADEEGAKLAFNRMVATRLPSVVSEAVVLSAKNALLQGQVIRLLQRGASDDVVTAKELIKQIRTPILQQYLLDLADPGSRGQLQPIGVAYASVEDLFSSIEGATSSNLGYAKGTLDRPAISSGENLVKEFISNIEKGSITSKNISSEIAKLNKLGVDIGIRFGGSDLMYAGPEVGKIWEKYVFSHLQGRLETGVLPSEDLINLKSWNALVALHNRYGITEDIRSTLAKTLGVQSAMMNIDPHQGNLVTALAKFFESKGLNGALYRFFKNVTFKPR